MPQLHMPLQSGSDRVLRGDAPLLPAVALPRDHRAGPRRDARGRHHHRHHRRLPRRDRGGLRGHPRRRAAGPVRRCLHLPVLQAARHAGRRPARPGAARRRQGPLPAARRAWSTTSPGRRTRSSSAAPSSCSSPRARAARTPPPAGCPGRGPDNRLVHFAAPADAARPGDLATVEITYAAPHHLVADRVLDVRRTRSGDAWEARTGEPAPAGVGLGMPTLGVPAPLPDASACR